MSDYFLVTYREDTWQEESGRYTFGWTNTTYCWPDAPTDRLSSFRYKLPAGWELRIHEARNRNSRYKAWRGNDREIWVKQAELPGFLRHTARAHTCLPPNHASIEAAFCAIQPGISSPFALKHTGGVTLPAGHASGNYHQQAIQRTARGEVVISGSAQDSGYLYFANADRAIVHLITPQHETFNHLGGLQIVDELLAVGYQRATIDSQGSSEVLFFDIDDICQPVALDHLTIERTQAGDRADGVALVKLQECWLVVVADQHAARLDFYLSTSLDLHNPNTRFTPTPVASWSKAANGLGPGSIDQNWGAYQNFNLFSQVGQPPHADDLWLVGMHTTLFPVLEDWADLYHLNFSKSGVVLTKKGKKRFTRSGNGPGFLYGSGFYFDRAARAFEVYACEAQLGDNATIMRCNLWL